MKLEQKFQKKEKVYVLPTFKKTLVLCHMSSNAETVHCWHAARKQYVRTMYDTRGTASSLYQQRVETDMIEEGNLYFLK